MEMNNDFRSEVHVAQKSRRDKLRVQQDHRRVQQDHRLNSTHHELSAYNNNAARSLQQIHAEQDGLNHHFSQVGNIRYDPSQLCSDMNTFSVNPQAATASSLLCKDSEKRVVLDPTFVSFSGTTPNHSDPQHFSSTWKSVGPQSSRSYSDNNWLANNHSQIFPCDHGLSGSSPSSLRIMNSNSTPMDHVQDMQCDSLPSQNNIAFEMLASTHSNVRSFGLEVEPFNKPETSDDRANEPRQVNWILGPSYANQSFLEGRSNLWNSDRDHHDHNNRLLPSHDINSNATQALYLTLSSVPSPKAHVADREAPSVVNIPANISQQINPGPLGPFTGYATILESSKFLRPTQQLLDEICSVVCPKNIETSIDVSDPRNFEESSVSNDAENHLSDKTTSSMLDSYQPENLQKKAKLMFMQEEVCKRYKHYHQQMQMVVSSFESVSALSAATPYISLALKTVSKHFRNLKNAIANKLKTLKNSFDEDHLSSSTASKGQFPGSSSSSSMLMKFPEQSFQRPKSGGSIGIIENQHVWRPQRGLPEHAVSVLRAWLFDHFLHPYPTDTDKHMLAAQTGLTRNQVSNWFINARVRVWKPMVEEVHMLETEAALSETERNNPEKSNAHSTPDPSRNNNPNRSLSGPNTISHAGINLPSPNVDIWKSQEKRSRTTEYDHRRHQVVNCDFDGSILGHVVPNSHHHSGLEMGGLGSVSLTLGLRQSAENGQMHHEHHQVRPCFGGQL